VSLGSLDDRPLQAGAIDGSREGMRPDRQGRAFRDPGRRRGARAKEFYSSVFDWRLSDADMGGGNLNYQPIEVVRTWAHPTRG
jgi:hypothetical protein